MLGRKGESKKITSLTRGQMGKTQDRCARCGACLSFCPVYQALSIERFSPRGKNYLLLSSDLKKRQRLIKQTVTACLQCGACSSLCASGADVASLIRRERGNFHYFQSLPHSIFSLWEKLGQEKSAKAASLLKGISPLFKDLSEQVKLAETPFLKDINFYRQQFALLKPLILPAKDIDPGKILFFTGCVQNLVLPETAAHIASFFEWQIRIPGEQSCCGLPAFSQGAFKQAASFAKRNIRLFLDHDFDTIVTGCASCAYMIKKWPALFAKDDKFYSMAVEVAEKVVELSQFVMATCKGPALKKSSIPGRAIVQVPCHQRFGLSAGKSPEDAARLILDEKLVPDTMGCCGLGGTFSLLNPDISKTIFQRNIRDQISDLNLKNVQYILTTCSGCMLRLSQGLNQERPGDAKAPILKHLGEILVEKDA